MSSHTKSHHVVPLKYYIGTFGALIVATVLTVWISRFDFGQFNMVVAMAIACTKASLVILFFMGLRWDSGFNRLFIIGSILFIIIFFVLVLSDTVFRGDYLKEQAGVHSLKDIVREAPADAVGHTSSSDH